ncbi:hypothetical protein JMJ35_008125 [Cladonia borealis]|uniref:Uncharacterized protein n=1 Tax=Cladonia borealis TaxID=184061 RepID=A0AA39QWJ3_9LECA|nr:hypothetical protein JMJ35_008125 [Cladonia borealis]
MSTTTTSTTKPHPTPSTHDTTPLLSPPTSPRRPGASLMTAPPSTLDPSTAALVAWAAEKEKQYPGQGGSFATGYGSTTMGWGAESWILPHKGDTALPPDQGKPEIVGGGEGGKGEKKKEGKRKRLSGLFRRKERK